MRFRQKLSRGVALLALLAAPAVAAQNITTGDQSYQQRRAIGAKILCNCPSKCSATVATCPMFRCSFKEAAHDEIDKGLQAGLSPDTIVANLVAKFGAEVGTAPEPSGFGLFGWMMPFLTLAIGLAIIPFVVRRWKARRPDSAAPGPREADENTLDRYRSRIEREIGDLD